MLQCATCETPLVRVRRRFLERLLYADAYECRPCGRRVRRLHSGLSVRYNFFVSRQARCVNCGTAKVQRVAKRDLLDSLSGHPVSQLQRLTCAPLIRCAACRLQFYDWRPTASKTARSRAIAPATDGHYASAAGVDRGGGDESRAAR